jgi:hypothetical protein
LQKDDRVSEIQIFDWSTMRTPEQLKADGFAALVEKLGVVDAIRFLHLYDTGRGDYTRDRHQWLDKLSHDDVDRLLAEAAEKRPRRK